MCLASLPRISEIVAIPSTERDHPLLSIMTTYLLKYLFVILHIITAAAWFGLGLRLSGRARVVLNMKEAAARALLDDTQRSVYLMNVFIILTLLFSLGAFLLGGGFAAYGPAYHTSLLLIVIMVLVQFLLIRRGWNGLQAALAGPDAPEAAESFRKRVAMGTGIGHLLWLIILVLMFWNQLRQAF